MERGLGPPPIPDLTLTPQIKLAFLSGTPDLNRELIVRVRGLFPELPLWVVSDFPPEDPALPWIRYRVRRSFAENLQRVRDAVQGRDVRLAVVEVRLPPLRERLEDLPMLVAEIFAEIRERTGAKTPAPTEEEIQQLNKHYWPGNVLWVRDRLVGVVDWEQPRLGDLVKDVATCRGDLWVLFGQAAADEFLHEYEQAAGSRVQNLRFWELFISTEAVRDMPEWAVAYRIMGRPDMTTQTAVPRIRAFAQAALERR